MELNCNNNWLTDWSIDRLIDWSIDRLIDWSIDRLIDWSIDWLIDWLIFSSDQVDSVEIFFTLNLSGLNKLKRAI